MSEVLDTRALVVDSSVILNLDIKGMKKALERITSKHLKPKTMQKRYKKLFNDYQKGLIKNDNEFFNKLFKGLKLSEREKNSLIKRHNKLRDSLVKLNKGINEVIVSLSKNYKIGLLSSMIKEWFKNDLKRLEFNYNLYFKSEVFTQDNGLLKTNKKLYFIICKLLKEKPKCCAYITNHAKEAKASSSAGMQTIFLGKKDHGDFNIKNLKELIELFNKTFYEPGPKPMSKKH